MMCENQYNFAPPWNNSFYFHYLQQHATLSYHFQKMHNNIHYGGQHFDFYNSTNVCNEMDCSSSCSSSCSCCSSGRCSQASPSEYEEEEAEEMDSEEYDEEQYQDEDCDEDESECEYEFNVDAILAMRAAKEELKKQEMLESKEEGSSESKDEQSSDSKSDKESKSDSIVLVDSDKEDFEFIDLSSTKILDCQLYKGFGGFNRTEEQFNRRYMMTCLFGKERSQAILGIEASMILNFDRLYDKEQPSLWPVLPLRL